MVAHPQDRTHREKRRKKQHPTYCMKRRNRLQIILNALGHERFKPTVALLDRLEMQRKRFYQILDNKGKHEVTVTEKELIENWLSELMEKPVALIHLMEEYTQNKAA